AVARPVHLVVLEDGALRVPHHDVAALLDAAMADLAAARVPQPDAVAAPRRLERPAGDGDRLEAAAVGLGGAAPPERVLDAHAVDGHVGGALDADAGVFGGVALAASAHGEAAHLDARRFDAQHRALAAAVEDRAGLADEAQPAADGEMLAVDAGGED